MPITQSESGLSASDYSFLESAETGSVYQVIAHRWNLDFDDFSASPNVTDNAGGDFNVALVESIFFRLSGTLLEKFSPATGGDEDWTEVSVFTPASGFIGSTPHGMAVDDATLHIFAPTTNGVERTSTDDGGDTWTAWETIVASANVVAVAAASHERVHYVYQDTDKNIYNLRCAEFNGSTWDVFQSDIWWTFPITSLDVVTLNGEDILVAASNIPGTTTVRYVNNKIEKYIFSSGGVVAFKYKYQSWSDHIEVEIVDDVRSWRYRDSVKASVMGDKMFLTAYSSDGTQEHPFTMYRTYTTKDGLWWSRGEGMPIENTGEDGIKLLRLGDYVYAFERQKVYRSYSTLQTGYSPTALQEDITHSIHQYEVNQEGMFSASLLVDNAGEWLDSHPFLDGGSTVALVHKFGYRDPANSWQPVMIDVAITEVDSIEGGEDIPKNTKRIVARDHLAWMADKSKSEQAHYWESQLLGGDNYADNSGTNYGGLKHTATQTGSFQTSGSKLVLASNNKEGLAFSTFSTYLWNGATQIGFNLQEANKAEQGGIVFRAIDKDNLWMFRYDQTSDKLKLIERSQGSDSEKAATGTLSWKSSPATVRYLRVEFRYARIRCYSSADGKTWTLQIEHLMEGAANGVVGPDLKPLTVAKKERGFVGVIGKGYAKPEQVWSSEPPALPDPTPITFVGGVDPDGLTAPAKFFALGYGSGEAAVCDQIVDGVANWRSIGAGLSGNGIWACSDPYNYYRRFAVTKDGLFRCDNIWAASPTWTLVKSSSQLYNVANTYPVQVLMSHNRQGWICLLSDETVSVSFDYGATFSRVNLSGATGNYGSTWHELHGNIALAGHNTASNGVLYASRAWYDGNWHNAICRSTNWGLTWTDVVTYSPNGMWNRPFIDIPYKRRDGTNNLHDGNFHLYMPWFSHRTFSPTSYLIKTYTGVSNLSWEEEFTPAMGGAPGHPVSGGRLRPLTTYTHDGDTFYFLLQQRGFQNEAYVYVTDDGGQNYTQVPGFAPQTTPVVNLNGFPLNKNFVLAYSGGINNILGQGHQFGADTGFITFTHDRGATPWTNITQGLPFYQKLVSYAEADLTDWIG